MSVNKPYEKLGLLIRAKRKEKGLTQEQLTQKLKCAKRNISFWESGQRKPKLEFCYALCKILGLKLDDFNISNSDGYDMLECNLYEAHTIIEDKKEAPLKLTDYLLQTFDTSFMNQHDIELFTKSTSTKIENTYIDILTRKERKCKENYLTGAYHNVYKCELLVHGEEYYTLENYVEEDDTYYSCYKLDDDFKKIESQEYYISRLIITFRETPYLIDWIIESHKLKADFSKFNMSKPSLEKYNKLMKNITFKLGDENKWQQ